MEPRIENFRAFNAVGLHYKGNNENNEISAMWDKFVPRMVEIKHRKGDLAFGICSPMSQNNAADGFEYIACVEVDSFDDMPEDMVTAVIEEGKYAVFTHKGNVSGIGNTFGYIYGTWAKNTDLQLDHDRSDFELYNEKFKGGGDDSEVDIYIPIK